jgi:hypothetical protein
MKALVSAVVLLTFVAGTALPVESYAQTSGTGQTMAPDTSTPATPTKKKRSSKSHHAKKKTKKSSTAQTSSAKQKHARHSVG